MWAESVYILLILAAATSSMTCELIPLAAAHAHTMTLPLPCLTHDVVCFRSRDLIQISPHHSDRGLSWFHLSKESDPGTSGAFLKVFETLIWFSCSWMSPVVVNPLYLHGWGRHLIVNPWLLLMSWRVFLLSKGLWTVFHGLPDPLMLFSSSVIFVPNSWFGHTLGFCCISYRYTLFCCPV